MTDGSGGAETKTPVSEDVAKVFQDAGTLPFLGWRSWHFAEISVVIRLPFPKQHVFLISVFMHRSFLSYPASDGTLSILCCVSWKTGQSHLRVTPQSDS